MLLRLEHQTTPGRGIVFMCPHAPKAGCFCRKPHPYLLYKSMKTARAAPSETLYVGDMDSDREAAQRAGVDFLWAWEFFGWEPVERQGPGGTMKPKLPTVTELEEILAGETNEPGQPPKAASVKLKFDLGEGSEDAIFVRPKRDILKASQSWQELKSVKVLLSQKTLTIPAGTLIAEYEVEGSAVQIAEQLNAESGENFTVTALFPTRIKVCTAKPFAVDLNVVARRGQPTPPSESEP